jgi:hypothetical protein
MYIHDVSEEEPCREEKHDQDAENIMSARKKKLAKKKMDRPRERRKKKFGWGIFSSLLTPSILPLCDAEAELL